MGNPSVEAAERAWHNIDCQDAIFDPKDPECAELIDAAQEALKPVQKWFRDLVRSECEVPLPVFRELEELAKLIFNQGEIPNGH